MSKAFASFINSTVIPENWKILSSRFDISKQTYEKQRMKIIGEIVEFYEAMLKYAEDPTLENLREANLELADIVISACTLLHIRETNHFDYETPFNYDPESWIQLVIQRRPSELIVMCEEYAKQAGISLEKDILRKLEINRTRSDW